MGLPEFADIDPITHNAVCKIDGIQAQADLNGTLAVVKGNKGDRWVMEHIASGRILNIKSEKLTTLRVSEATTKLWIRMLIREIPFPSVGEIRIWGSSESKRSPLIRVRLRPLT